MERLNLKSGRCSMSTSAINGNSYIGGRQALIIFSNYVVKLFFCFLLVALFHFLGND